MQPLPASVLATVATWPDHVRAHLEACREIFHNIAADAGVGPLEESLKWGQPAWRPLAPRTGSTLRLNWAPVTCESLLFFVDCKTDIAARMRDIYPDLPQNDGRRRLAIGLDTPLPVQALSHLAEMTFTYHLARSRPAIG